MRFEWLAALVLAAAPVRAEDDNTLPPPPPPPPGAALEIASHDGSSDAVPEKEPNPWGPRHERDPRYAFDPPVKEPGDFKHDGFLLRFAAGPAYVLGEVSGSLTEGAVMAGYGGGFDAVALRVDATIGGSVFEGLALGLRGGFLLLPDPQLDATSPFTGSEIDVAAAIAPMVGLVADWYPQPDSGLHLYGGPSFTMFNLSDDGAFKTTELIGIMASFGLGYEAWVSEQWSFGALAGVDLAFYGGDTDDEAHFVVPGLQLAFTYH